MKKYLLILAVFFGLQAQAQFFPGPCDSVDVVVNSGSTSTSLMLDGIDLGGTVVGWYWEISNTNTLNNTYSTQNITCSPVSPNDSLLIALTTINNLGDSCRTMYISNYVPTGWTMTSIILFPGTGGGTSVGPGSLGNMSTHCDSITIDVDPLSTSTNVILNGNATALLGTVTSWSWDVYSNNGFVQASTTQSISVTANTTDTLMAFLETTIDVNGVTYICLHFGSVYHNGTNWIFNSSYTPVGPSNPGGGIGTGTGVGNLSSACDSVSISVNSSSTYNNIVFDGTISGTAQVLDWHWDIFDVTGNYHYDSLQTVTYNNSTPSDTVAVFLMTTISDAGAIFTCMTFDIMVFNNGVWSSMRVGGGGTTGIETIHSILDGKKLLKVVDVLGRDAKEVKNAPLFYIYDDGSVERKMIIE
jgi:hypothetical protein